ncbi:YitT family protein [Prolixibacter sp. SD074]|jgi:uncharacterized membrane-anchored protein YitT (DUF2179 family)|uniref:YitT family protein n=1 Tax=Prolixibacter sp. SD074 TaxID=2652391 RepID=UPI001272FC90|nr:YitT family protein [Prolixibacter sp. SD074]GET30178.1 membrane protein [Prolixibacter sp. SD074]
MSGKVMSKVQDYAIIVPGLFIYAFGVTAFLIPAKIIGGGITGVATVVYLTSGIETGYTYFVINIFLVLAAIKILGTSFGLKTIFSMSVMAVFLNVLQSVFTKPLIDDLFLSAVLGGILGGVGLGIVFNRGGSTGGTDIIAMIINKYRNVSPGRVIMFCDVIIIASSFFVLKSVEGMVYGYVSMWVVSYTVDSVLNGAKQSVQMFIFSERYDDIADYIVHQANRGLTVFDGTGWYTRKNVKVIMTVVRKREASPIYKQIKQIDPDAFISQNSVMGVFGNGFDQIKY